MAKRKSTNLVKVKNQVSFLERYLRGTNKTLSVAQAQANYGIEKLTTHFQPLVLDLQGCKKFAWFTPGSRKEPTSQKMLQLLLLSDIFAIKFLLFNCLFQI